MPFFIDPSRSVNGSGTETSPYNVVPTISSGNVYLFKRGTRHRGATVLIPDGSVGVTLGAYGTGEMLPIIDGANQRIAVRFGIGASLCVAEDLEVLGSSSSTQNTIGVYLGSNESNRALNCTVRRCVIHDVVGNGFGDCNLMQVFGSDCVVEDNYFYNAPDDGCWQNGPNFVFRRNKVVAVGLKAGISGDGLQLSGSTGGGGNFRIEDNYIETLNGEKQGIIISGASAGSGGIIRGNRVIFPYATGGQAAVFNDQPNVRIEGNRISGGYMGIFVDTTGTGCVVRGNVIDNSYRGIQPVAAGSKLHNNTILYAKGQGIQQSLADATTEIKNNIVYGCQSGIHCRGEVARDYNCYYATIGSNFVSTGGGGSIDANAVLTDPQFDERYAPLNVLVSEGGTFIAGVDHYGKPYRLPMAIGAVVPQPQRSVASSRSAVVRRGVRG